MRATVVIVTRNRREDLAKAIVSTLGQTANPEVLVIDDGSSDGTPHMVGKRFPQVRLVSRQESGGYIRARNQAACLAGGDIVFSIDDDAAFSSPHIVETTLKEFNHSLIGAVAIPFVDVNRGPRINQRAPDQQEIYACYSYIGTAHALRRDLFLALSGYRENLCHQGEEEDYCIRMLNAGYITRCGSSDPIHHFESPQRSLVRMDYYGARNKILFAFQNVPFPQVIWHLAVTTTKTLLFSLRPDRFWTRLRGVLAAFKLCLLTSSRRVPVSRSTYQLSRRLKTSGPLPLGLIWDSIPHVSMIASHISSSAPA